MARREFEITGVKALCKAFTSYIINADKDLSVSTKQIDDVLKGGTLYNDGTYFDPRKELKKNAEGNFDKKSFDDLFDAHRGLANVQHNKNDITGLKTGGLKSLESIVQELGKEIETARNGKATNIETPAFENALREYRITKAYDKKLEEHIPPKELFDSVFSASGLKREDFDGNQKFSKLKSDFVSKFSKTQCASNKISNLAGIIKCIFNRSPDAQQIG